MRNKLFHQLLQEKKISLLEQPYYEECDGVYGDWNIYFSYNGYRFYGVGIIISIYLMITTNGLSEREVIAQMKERIIIGYIWEIGKNWNTRILGKPYQIST